MKTLIATLACIVLFGCNAYIPPTEVDATLRTERKEFEKGDGGRYEVENTYRGGERIMMVTSYSNVTSRAFCLHGDAVYIESDEDGDGIFETFIISGDTMDEFEKFERTPDGNVNPISGGEYLKLKRQVHEATEFLSRSIKDATQEAEEF